MAAPATSRLWPAPRRSALEGGGGAWLGPGTGGAWLGPGTGGAVLGPGPGAGEGAVPLGVTEKLLTTLIGRATFKKSESTIDNR